MRAQPTSPQPGCVPLANGLPFSERGGPRLWNNKIKRTHGLLMWMNGEKALWGGYAPKLWNQLSGFTFGFAKCTCQAVGLTHMKLLICGCILPTKMASSYTPINAPVSEGSLLLCQMWVTVFLQVAVRMNEGWEATELSSWSLGSGDQAGFKPWLGGRGQVTQPRPVICKIGRTAPASPVY